MESSKPGKIVVAKICVIAAAVPFLVWAYASGPDPRHTGAPGDRTCAAAGCHVGNLNTGTGKVEIAFPAGLTYVPGQKQTWTVTVTHSGARVYGFQASARLESNATAGQAGTFSAAAGDSSIAILCDDGSVRPASGCRDNFKVEFIEHSRPSNSGTWTIEWTPPATNVGNVRVYIAGNGANGNGTNTGDFIYTANYTLAPGTGGGGGGPRPTIAGLADAWVGATGLAPNTWMGLFGTNLAAGTKTWDDAIQGARLPTTLEGVSVSIANKPATVFFVSPSQVNVLVPNDIGTGDVPVVVKTANGESEATTVRAAAVKPTFYVFPQQAQGGRVYLTAVALDGTFVGRMGTDPRVTRAARPGEVLQVFGTGFGATNPVVATDQIVSGAPAVTTPVRIRFGETVATIAGNGNLVAAGLYQFNVTVPATLADGEYPLIAEVGGVSSSNTVHLVVRR